MKPVPISFPDVKFLMGDVGVSNKSKLSNSRFCVIVCCIVLLGKQVERCLNAINLLKRGKITRKYF